jgi:hypothetical protein
MVSELASVYCICIFDRFGCPSYLWMAVAAPNTANHTSHVDASPGKRHSVKVTPMQPLSVVISMVASASKQQLEPAACTLHHKGTALDLSTPVRFAGLPTGATLELRTGDSAYCSKSWNTPAQSGGVLLHARRVTWHHAMSQGRSAPWGFRAQAPGPRSLRLQQQPLQSQSLRQPHRAQQCQLSRQQQAQQQAIRTPQDPSMLLKQRLRR